MRREVCVCVPARNEAARLPILLDALAVQAMDATLRVSLCVNNSDDGSALTALAWAVAAPGSIDLDVVETDFAPPLDHAGSARRAAMDRGAELLGEDGAVLVSTDADCRPPRGWIAAILAALSEDDMVVGGRIVADDAEPADARLVALRRRWDRYWEKVRAIEDAFDPVAWDPPPRHGDHTGASLALTVGLYRRCGGVPVLAAREDLGLVEAALGAGGRLVHPPAVWTRASARTEGRAEGGMAQAMARLDECAAAGTPPRVPDFGHWDARARWRHAARPRWPVAEMLARERALPDMPCDMPLPELD